MDVHELFDVALSEQPCPQGPAAAPRAQLRDAVLREADRRRTRRSVSRAAAVAVAVLLAVTASWIALRSPPRAAPPERDTRPQADWVTAVRNDPTVVERLRASPPTPLITRVSDRAIDPGFLLDDGGLSRWLHAAGRPGAVLRTADRVVVAEPSPD